MRHLLWIVLLLSIQLGCSKSGTQAIDLSDTPPPPKTQAEIDAEMAAN